MPARTARAAFGPIPPDLDLKTLIETSPNFDYAPRISYQDIAKSGTQKLEQVILQHVILGGKPLVIDGFEGKLDKWIFNPKWLRDNHGDKVEQARNLTSNENIPLTINHYLNHMGQLTDQFFQAKDNYKDKNRQRIYLKDIDCPDVWQDKLKDIIPLGLFYWNDSIGTADDPGAPQVSALHGAGAFQGKGIAAAGDLMSSLPQEMRAENLMCYVGHEGTYTAAHREMCASLGQNIMVHTSDDTVDELGKPQKPGSSIWFMTKNSDRRTVSEYFLSVLGHNIELETHFAQIGAWQKAPFPVYVVDQNLGDFVLVPPLAPHQVWNRGSCTIKVAWNRTTVNTLEMAINEALPNSRLVCRDEQYKNKAMIYYSLMKYSSLIRNALQLAARSPQEEQVILRARKIRQLMLDFKILFNLFKEIMLSEMFGPETKEYCEFVPFDSNVICSYCRANVFNRFLTCKSCANMCGGDDPYDICMDCFVTGRGCHCQSKYKWVEQFKWADLCKKYEDWRRLFIDLNQVESTGYSPCSLTDERQMFPKTTLAHICQNQLRVRPWVDPLNDKGPAEEEEEEESEEELQMTAVGQVKKIKKKKSQAYLNKTIPCHSCIKRNVKWKMAICSCGLGWCYGVLYRGYDLLPQTVMEDPNWQCPHCLGICSTGACQRTQNHISYHPQKTILGHDTKKVADRRSQEILVDFSMSNQRQIRDNGGPLEQARISDSQVVPSGSAIDGFMDIDAAEEVLDDAIQWSPIIQNIDPALGGSLLGPSANEEPPLLSLAQANETDGELMEHAALADSTSIYPEFDEPHASSSNYIHTTPGLHEPEANNHDGSSFNATNAITVSMESSGKKRKSDALDGIKLHRPRKRKTLPDSPGKNKASKQYEEHNKKKLLEQAQKEGRYIIVWAKLEKKSIVVNLQLPPETLRSFFEREIANRMKQSRSRMQANKILESDIVVPQESNPTEPVKQTPAAKPKIYRARVEPDSSYTSSRRPKKQTAKSKFEEIVEEEDEEDVANANTDTLPQSSATQPRSSRAALRRNAEDGGEDFPDELPANFKDGTVYHRNRRRKSSNAEARPIAQKGPTIRPTHDAEDADEEEQEPAASGGATEASTAGLQAMKLARLSLIEEENRVAKLQAANWANGEASDEETLQPNGQQENQREEQERQSQHGYKMPERRGNIPVGEIVQSGSDMTKMPSSTKSMEPSAAVGLSLKERMGGKKFKISGVKSKGLLMLLSERVDVNV